ncbi:hypothetical protein M5X00_31720 [Paenibacillus alvei]|uniref:hypothetical protein n=1 Tax=Paenibacillus alvei TaxID=44250 RepID=UPI00028965F8|nr:hypothetical protein [Paenibacillus alvei]EJW14114.1 hypothetical protein PAV_21c00030 [Paenibacillus alvei DSM 29]EJW16424.1 hypothetical protein PAV_5c00030 [Paenibacillus alvei DSM 29]MCY9544802.1 hypothetical protein [Paenibacillus alvei]MCY9708577.1 hypothetical protein [Paenibacillus alvei]MCY9738355.1 hypothetical protein [Paenibacillus alvei]
MKDQIPQYIQEIKRLRLEADEYDDESPGGLMQRITLLTQAHTLIGRVSAHMDGQYKRKYAERKNTFAAVKAAAGRGDKTTQAELATMELREQEAEAFERMHLWRNEFKSLTEQLHELRLRLRIDLNIGIGGG